jgi:hypothetical protein
MMFCFVEDEAKKELCKTKLSDKDLNTMREAIEDLYYFEFVVGKFEKTTLAFFSSPP